MRRLAAHLRSGRRSAHSYAWGETHNDANAGCFEWLRRAALALRFFRMIRFIRNSLFVKHQTFGWNQGMRQRGIGGQNLRRSLPLDRGLTAFILPQNENFFENPAESEPNLIPPQSAAPWARTGPLVRSGAQ